MNNSLKGFALGTFLTVVLAAGCFGLRAHAEPQQVPKPPSSKLVTIDADGAYYSVNAALVDEVDAFDVGNGLLEVHVYTYAALEGDTKELFSVQIPKKTHDAFLSDVNRLRN